MAVGPLVITWWASSYGLNGIFVIGIPGIVSVILCLRFVAYMNSGGERDLGKGLFEDLRPFLKPLTLLFTIIVVTSVVRLGMVSFMPLLLTNQGMSLPEVGIFLSASALMGSTGSMVGAMAADRWGRKRVMFISLILSFPLLHYYFIHPGLLGLMLIVLGSAAMNAPCSVIVAIGQEAIPHRSGIVSALLMGFAWGVAGLMMTPMGVIAEELGLFETLRWATYLPLIGASTLLLVSDRSLKPGRA
jgi:FSR family fosmidomycin resistance protein-like MFS transporter